MPLAIDWPSDAKLKFGVLARRVFPVKPGAPDAKVQSLVTGENNHTFEPRLFEPRRLAGRMVPPTSISGKSELNNHTFKSRLFEPKSPFPGNGILPAETKAPKRLRKAKETIAAT